MTYAIVGSGAIGGALARQFARSSINVLLANSRGPETLRDMVSEFEPFVSPASISEALQADIVVLAVPFDSVPEVAGKADAWNGRIVVDATNAIDFPAFKPRNLGGRQSTKIIAEKFPGARVVKAFNTLPAAVLAADPAQDGGQRVLFLSGDDASANTEVANLIRQLGFAPIELGMLAEGGLLQQFGAPLVAQNLTRHG